MATRSRGVLFVGLTLVFVGHVAAEGPRVRHIGPDDASGLSAAVVVDTTIPLAHTAQLLPLDAQGRIISPGRAGEQAEALLDRLEMTLREVRSGLDRLVKVNVYAARPEAISPFKAAFTRRMAGKGGPAISYVVGGLAHPEAILALDVVAATSLAPREGEVLRISPAALTGRGSGGPVAILPAGGRVYVSGQAEPGPNLAQATRRTLEGLDATLNHLRLKRSQVVQLKAFLSPIASAADVEREVTAFFGADATPPLVLVEWRLSSLPIEIELIAAAGPDKGREAIEYLTPPRLKPSPVYSRVARVNHGDLIFVSGLHGPAGASGEKQVAACFDALGKIVAEAGGDLRHLVKATYYVTDDEASRALTALRPKYYDPARPPAASKATVAGVGAEGRSITLDMIAVPASR